jgi:hypothetical protein
LLPILARRLAFTGVVVWTHWIGPQEGLLLVATVKAGTSPSPAINLFIANRAPMDHVDVRNTWRYGLLWTCGPA